MNTEKWFITYSIDNIVGIINGNSINHVKCDFDEDSKILYIYINDIIVYEQNIAPHVYEHDATEIMNNIMQELLIKFKHESKNIDLNELIPKLINM